MNDSLRIILITAAVLGVVGGAMAAEPTTAELMERIKQLQSKVQELEKQQDEQRRATTPQEGLYSVHISPRWNWIPS